MQERINLASYSPRGCGHAQQDLFRSTTHGGGIHGIELDERAALSFGLESRHPFNDRRLIEFALALPEEQRWRDGSKFILRQALKGILPRSVCERTDKADFSCIFARTLLTESTAAIFRSLAVASMGWVDGGRIWNDYESMASLYSKGNENYRFHVSPLWMILGIELWWRTMFLGQSMDPSLQLREEYVPLQSS
jgi:asparagine synthetase B (glutamine-hydrolysing)